MGQSKKEVVGECPSQRKQSCDRPGDRPGALPAGMLGAERRMVWLEEVSEVGSRPR